MAFNIHIIGESSLAIDFIGDTPREAHPEGVMLNTAIDLARSGTAVDFVSEAAPDPAGDIIVARLNECGAGTSCVDRFTSGSTQILLRFADGRSSRYGNYGDAEFSVVWPRIGRDDIVMFGGHHAIDPRVRPRLVELLRHARDVNATLVYIPEYDPSRVRSISYVKAAILENIETAHITVTRDSDLAAIFGVADAAEAFRRHASFYADIMVNLSNEGLVEAFFAKRRDLKATATLPRDHASLPLLASKLAASLKSGFITPERLDSPDSTLAEALIKGL